MIFMLMAAQRFAATRLCRCAMRHVASVRSHVFRAMHID